jgi:hypothetical protein
MTSYLVKHENKFPFPFNTTDVTSDYRNKRVYLFMTHEGGWILEQVILDVHVHVS